jgi:squalene-hopene/tetraprenyl-beta-curcumene cyclase
MSDPQRLLAAYEAARDRLLAEREPNGHWVGELATSALSTATAVSALALVERHDATDGKGCFVDEARESLLSELIVKGIRWLAEHQNDDGGWGDTEKSYSNIATTMLAVAAFHLTGVPADHADLLERAEQYIDQNGRIDGLRRRYGKDKTFAVPILTNCALADLVPWKVVSPLPFEAACVPQRFYHLLKLPVVSYAIPALVGIGQARYFYRKPWNPIARLVRKIAVAPSLKVLRRMQPQSGGYLEAVPLTSFVVMSLAGTGRVDHAVVQSGVQFLIDSVRPDGSWPIDTNLATWNTTLSINALAAGGEDVAALDIHPTATQGKRLEVVNSGSPEGTAVGSLGREPQDSLPN